MGKARLITLASAFLLCGLSAFAGTGISSEVPEGAAFACSCFAVFSGDEPVYGMNFDYPDTEVKLRIRPSLGRTVFEMQFEKEGRFLETVGMNSDGLFVSSQFLFPEMPGQSNPGPGELFTWQVYTETLPRYSTVQEVVDFIGENRIVHCNVSLHQFVADSSGEAMVVEAGPKGNRITPMEDDFLVMTNFPVCEFRGRDYRETVGVGADRYQVLHQQIRKNRDDFTMERAMEALAAASMEGHWATRCSMVFLPLKGEIFVSFDREYDRIWKVSLEQKTIETWAGAEESFTRSIGFRGVTASSLQRGESTVPPWLIWAVHGKRKVYHSAIGKCTTLRHDSPRFISRGGKEHAQDGSSTRCPPQTLQRGAQCTTHRPRYGPAS